MMAFLTNFVQAFINYSYELWWSLALGFFLSGLLYEFIPANLVDKHLSKGNLKSILLASIVGMILPVCCFGSLPIAVTLRNKGARLGPVLAFLVATPATSVSALIVCWKMLGVLFTVYIFVVVIIMGVVIGLVGNTLGEGIKRESHAGHADDDCCHHEAETKNKSAVQKFKDGLKYAFITLPKEIGTELLLGIAVASFIIICDPIQTFIQKYLIGAFGYLFIILFGLATYVCSTASVPLADAFLKSGMNGGHAMTYLLVGPITSYGTIFVMHKEFGGKVLGVYLLLVTALSVLFGIAFEIGFIQ